jgi:predicted DCC family thiol-disulfide oxidoreductase YuxK
MQMKNGWTNGQYAIYRVIFGLYLLQHFLGLLPWGGELFSSGGVLPNGSFSPLIHLFPNIFAFWDAPLFVESCLGIGAVLSLFFIFAKFDRMAAVLIWYLLACLYGRNPLIGNPSLPFIGWLLLAHTLMPLQSRGRAIENEYGMGAAKPPADIYVAAWILMSLAYTYSGYTKLISPSWLDGSALSRVLSNPLARDTFLRTFLLGLPPWILKAATWSGLTLELSFSPLALFRRVRPLLWLAMICMHLGLLVLVNFSDLTAGMLILHFFTLDPAWIPCPRAQGQTIFFDGTCGLCHGFVRFVLKEDWSAQPFSFSPLQGESLRSALPEQVRVNLPDSVVVIDNKKSILVRSSAVIYVMKRLGGLWFIVAIFLTLVPRRLRDLSYIAVASLRKKIFGGSEGICPIVRDPWRARFLR